ncbi:MAG: DMT family protein [Candidatus Anaerobiospirillum merdipullorum]|uniref:DMT family protein n=1 Tax=Candidatus Anaerobiospirillum merdipullorum TaxID=2838450 RepID=A0A9E2KNU9_9GAMM|nr:DMT family protein [Candidatus Anaerobiospirillum merdipullorum]
MFAHGLYAVGLLVLSNIFMTLAWYGHLKMREEFSWFSALPLIGVIAFSWGLAFFEYCLQVPANRLGFKDNGGPFDIMQLKVIQEVVTLTVFTIFSILAFHTELKWNHLLAACCLIAAVYFSFKQ